MDMLNRDTRRTKYLESHGYRVIRFWDNDALARTDQVVEQISNLLKDPHPPRAKRGGLSLPGRGAFRTIR